MRPSHLRAPRPKQCSPAPARSRTAPGTEDHPRGPRSPSPRTCATGCTPNSAAAPTPPAPGGTKNTVPLPPRHFPGCAVTRTPAQIQPWKSRAREKGEGEQRH
eukprot:1121829-Pyramimonas_sp.AAC.1